jgi:predicted HTH transcriptional regulator
MTFLKSILRHKQDGQNFNKVGILEIPEVVLEELLQNAFVHIDLLHAAAIRVLVFNDRVEIINPGCLYGGLQVEDIKLGVSRQRNPLIASLASKTMIYRGLGSGIIRVMNENISVDFINEESANQFKTIIWRTIQKNENTIQKNENTIQKNENTIQKNENTIQKSLTTIQKEVLEFLKNNPNSTLVEVIDSVPNLSEGGLKFIIMKLKKLGLLKREGGRKSGVWVVVDNK